VIRGPAAGALFALRRASPQLARVDRERRREGLNRARIQRLVDEPVGGARADTRPDDGQEILSKL
jgi:hypothetical protein